MILFMSAAISYAQTKDQTESSGVKTNSQATLYNDFYVGYGALDLFYFTGRMQHGGDFPTVNHYYNDQYYYYTFNEPSSVGTFYIGYARSLNRVISTGIMFGFQDFTYSGVATSSGSGTPTTYTVNVSDILVSASARILFNYMNKPAVKIYSGIGIGLTVDFGVATENGTTYNERKLWPGGQLTLMGIRFGRAFGGFLEFGVGTFGIVNAGLSYKFKD